MGVRLPHVAQIVKRTALFYGDLAKRANPCMSKIPKQSNCACAPATVCPFTRNHHCGGIPGKAMLTKGLPFDVPAGTITTRAGVLSNRAVGHASCIPTLPALLSDGQEDV